MAVLSMFPALWVCNSAWSYKCCNITSPALLCWPCDLQKLGVSSSWLRKKLEQMLEKFVQYSSWYSLCDRSGCPKAYHPSCVNCDEAFFRAKGRWNCGWHLCSNCEKSAHYMCYTCNFFLVQGVYQRCCYLMCSRKQRRKNEQGNKDKDEVDFDDKSSWEYLFKDYWIDLKDKLSQFDVQALLLEYIKRNKLRDRRRKSQIVCDTRLQNLFGNHFIVKEDAHADDLQGSVVDTEDNQLEVDGNSDTPAQATKD